MNNKKLLIFLIICLAAILIVLGVLIYRDHRPALRVYFLNVGQGDAIFIKTPSAGWRTRRIIIDGGPDNRVLAELGRHLPFYSHRLDLMILTHPDSDHLTGLLEIIKRYPVAKILTTGALTATPQFAEWQNLIKEKNINVQIAQAGQEFDFGPVKAKVIYPLADLSGQSPDNLNNSSIVIRLDYGADCFLFTGDAEIKAEEEILKEGTDLDCDVLKVSHHGSDTGSGQEFLATVSPDYAVIQTGRNNYGLPSLRIIRRLERLGAKVFRNDLSGEIRAVSDGRTLQVGY